MAESKGGKAVQPANRFPLRAVATIVGADEPTAQQGRRAKDVLLAVADGGTVLRGFDTRMSGGYSRAVFIWQVHCLRPVGQLCYLYRMVAQIRMATQSTLYQALPILCK